MAKLIVAGVGPGGEEYILPVVQRIAAEADILVGGARALAPFLSLGKETLAVTADLAGLVTQVKELAGTKKIAILVSGDPGFYSLLAFLKKHFRDDELEVYPGISSLQVAFARLGILWHDAVLLSAHGRDGRELLPPLLGPGRKAVLTDRAWTPSRLATLVLDGGGADTEVTLCYRLTSPDEKIVKTHLSALDESVEGDCVMVIEDV